MHSSSASATICENWFEDHLIVGRNPFSHKHFSYSISSFCSSLTVDVKNGGLQPAFYSVNGRKQEIGISEVGQTRTTERLSQILTNRWSKLVGKIIEFRGWADRKQKLLQVTNRIDSSLASCGHVDDTKNRANPWS